MNVINTDKVEIPSNILDTIDHDAKCGIHYTTLFVERYVTPKPSRYGSNPIGCRILIGGFFVNNICYEVRGMK